MRHSESEEQTSQRPGSGEAFDDLVYSKLENVRSEIGHRFVGSKQAVEPGDEVENGWMFARMRYQVFLEEDELFGHVCELGKPNIRRLCCRASFLQSSKSILEEA